VVNLVKNAVEAITEGDSSGGGTVRITVRSAGDRAYVEVADTGRGLPREGRSRLTEPYMTTRSKGTGLGLAIVKKAVEEHGGEFVLLEGGVDGVQGATARIALPLQHKERTRREVPAGDADALHKAVQE
jgi:two-component system nitrogen regulation sensor histidine kinase NtrY